MCELASIRTLGHRKLCHSTSEKYTQATIALIGCPYGLRTSGHGRQRFIGKEEARSRGDCLGAVAAIPPYPKCLLLRRLDHTRQTLVHQGQHRSYIRREGHYSNICNTQWITDTQRTTDTQCKTDIPKRMVRVQTNHDVSINRVRPKSVRCDIPSPLVC